MITFRFRKVSLNCINLRRFGFIVPEKCLICTYSNDLFDPGFVSKKANEILYFVRCGPVIDWRLIHSRHIIVATIDRTVPLIRDQIKYDLTVQVSSN